MNAIGDADIDENIVALMLQKKVQEIDENIVEQKREMQESHFQIGQQNLRKTKKKFHGYMTNDSVLGKLDSGNEYFFFRTMLQFPLISIDRKYLNSLMKNQSFKNMENVNKDSKKIGVLVTSEQYLRDR